MVSKGWLSLIKKHLEHSFETSWNLNSASHNGLDCNLVTLDCSFRGIQM